MPRPTFFALPDDKRARVVAAAVAEFGAHAYGDASLDRIAADARVAKGSLYQYFDDKADLYRWLITEHLPAAKQAMSLSSSSAPPADLFDFLALAFERGVTGFVDNPSLSALAARVSQPAVDGTVADVHAVLAEQRFAGVLQLVRSARAAGVVRADVDDEVAAELVVQWLGVGLLAVMARRLGVTLDALLRAPALVASMPVAQRTALVAQAVDMVRRAVGAPSPASPLR